MLIGVDPSAVCFSAPGLFVQLRERKRTWHHLNSRLREVFETCKTGPHSHLKGTVFRRFPPYGARTHTHTHTHTPRLHSVRGRCRWSQPSVSYTGRRFVMNAICALSGSARAPLRSARSVHKGPNPRAAVPARSVA